MILWVSSRSVFLLTYLPVINSFVVEIRKYSTMETWSHVSKGKAMLWLLKVSALKLRKPLFHTVSLSKSASPPHILKFQASFVIYFLSSTRVLVLACTSHLPSPISPVSLISLLKVIHWVLNKPLISSLWPSLSIKLSNLSNYLCASMSYLSSSEEIGVRHSSSIEHEMGQ